MLRDVIPAYPSCATRTEFPIAGGMSPAQTETSLRKGRFEIEPDVRFAWLKALDATEKPHVCPSIDSVARHVQAARKHLTIELEDGDYEPMGLGGAVLPIVTVYGAYEGTRTELLGHAYIDGRPWEALQAALEAIERPARSRIIPRRWKA